MTRPAPIRTPLSQPFWDAIARGQLVIQHCGACGRLQHYPRPWCTACLSDVLDWQHVSGNAIVYAHTIVRRALNPAFNDAVPYVYALVDLDEGVRMTTNIVGVVPDDVRIGMRVRVVFEPVADGGHVPVFTPLL